ncbi:MAG: hypothetical protein ACOZAO_01420 [Patescibacteria group bacterium]
MIEKRIINEQLAKTTCYRCGNSLEGGELVPISHVHVALIAHVICPKCQAESMVTITLSGSGAMPIISDLTGEEVKKFLGIKSISYNELLDIHQKLKKKSICKLLYKKEKN